MQYHPKLKVAMREIKAIMNKYDIGGLVVLHTPGNGEFLMKLDPSYSCAKIEQGMVRIRAKADEYPGGAKERNKRLADTANMLRTLSDVGYNTVNNLMNVANHLDLITEAEHNKGRYTYDNDQNN